MKKRAKPKACLGWGMLDSKGNVCRDVFETKKAARDWAWSDDEVIRVLVTPITKKRRKK
jgi:hypothetical protein